VAELRTLCDHPQSDVKVEALAAYARWGGEDARGLCLAASRSPGQEERMMALRLLPRWKDPEVARAVASRIGRPSYETTFARDALLEIGGPAAEQAAIPLLRSEEQNTRLTAIDILEKVGGADAVEALKDLAGTTDDSATRQRATAKAQAIQTRLRRE
jgi:HEAT repeat protein